VCNQVKQISPGLDEITVTKVSKDIYKCCVLQ